MCSRSLFGTAQPNCQILPTGKCLPIVLHIAGYEFQSFIQFIINEPILLFRLGVNVECLCVLAATVQTTCTYHHLHPPLLPTGSWHRIALTVGELPSLPLAYLWGLPKPDQPVGRLVLFPSATCCSGILPPWLHSNHRHHSCLPPCNLCHPGFSTS